MAGSTSASLSQNSVNIGFDFLRGVFGDNIAGKQFDIQLTATDVATGAVRYRVTPLFERVFNLESLSALPRLDDFGDDAEDLRNRLEAVAVQRPA